MSKQRIQELQELTARISKLDISKLSESQLAERNTLINNIKEELTKIKEVSDKTLTSYLTKVDADSRKHEKDPTKRSPEKASKSVGGFARAFNKLDARKEQGVAEGSSDRRKQEQEADKWLEKRIMKCTCPTSARNNPKCPVHGKKEGVAEGEYKSRHIHRQEQNKKYDEYRRSQEAAGKKPMSRGDWAATQRKGQQGVAEGSLAEGQYEMMMRNGQVKKFVAKDDADAKRIAAGHGAKSVIRLKGGVPAGKVSEQGVAESDLAQQMMALAKSKGMNARIAGTPDEERARTQQMMAQRAKERQEQEQQAAQADAANLPELKAKYEEMKKLYQSLGGSNWQYADREQNLSDAERKARSMEPELNRLAAQIHRAEKTQGVAEGMLDNPGKEDSPVAQAIIRRILMQRVDLLSKYGPEAVAQAIDSVADFVGDVDEIGSSDVSGWVRHVERILSDSTGITTEAYDRLKKVFDFTDFKG